MTIKYSEVQTIEDVRKFVEQHPTHIITSAWEDMLEQIDEFGEEYTIDDFCRRS